MAAMGIVRFLVVRLIVAGIPVAIICYALGQLSELVR